MQNMLPRVTFLIVLLFPTLSSAMAVSNMFVFGDSLSDGGNVFNVTGGLFPPSPYAQRFSNGPVAVEQFAKLAGVTLTPSTTGGNNYAYGGAATGVVAGTADTDNYLSKSTQGLSFLNGTGIQNQVDQFIASGKGFDPNQSLFVVWGGPNDIFTWLDGYAAATINEVIAGAVTNIFNSISALAANGAENFLIPNMVDLGMTPFGIKQGGLAQFGLTQISNGFNAFLDQSLDAIVGPNIFRPDVNNLLQLVQADPAAYGFDNVTDTCFDRASFTTCAHPDRYLFWDDVHPTERGHALIAGEFYATAIPEPSIITLIGIAVLMGFGKLSWRHKF